MKRFGPDEYNRLTDAQKERVPDNIRAAMDPGWALSKIAEANKDAVVQISGVTATQDLPHGSDAEVNGEIVHVDLPTQTTATARPTQWHGAARGQLSNRKLAGCDCERD